jgi:hypothetical protein
MGHARADTNAMTRSRRELLEERSEWPWYSFIVRPFAESPADERAQQDVWDSTGGSSSHEHEWDSSGGGPSPAPTPCPTVKSTTEYKACVNDIPSCTELCAAHHPLYL